MPAKIVITALNGAQQGTKYRFDEQMLCMIGRADNCTLQLQEEDSEGVSRHHCMLELNPPAVAIRDLGSRNGTFLNGVNIGRKNEKDSTETVQTYEMKDHDHFSLGKIEFEVSIHPGLQCAVCRAPLPDDYVDASAADPSQYRCAKCKAAALDGKTDFFLNPEKTHQIQRCSRCGTILSVAEEGEALHSEYLCTNCRTSQDLSRTVKIEQFNASSNLLQLPGYRIIKKLGRGGMGEVYLAQMNSTHEIVALKILLPNIAANEEYRRDFIREADNLKPLRHPNIVELKDCDYACGAFYLALEYCSCGTLRETMKRRNELFDLKTALHLTYQILDGLEYAHQAKLIQYSEEDQQEHEVCGIVHRDIKPENIFLERRGMALNAKIADFGIAKAFDLAGLSGCTRTGDFSGTLGFIPKQQFINFKYVKPEVDVWAAAATFFYMLTGQPPRDFSKGEIMDVFNEVSLELYLLNDEVPRAVSDVIASALNDSEALRFKTAASLKYALMDAMNRC